MEENSLISIFYITVYIVHQQLIIRKSGKILGVKKKEEAFNMRC